MTKITFLGVVNATPNSFSDGHKNLSKEFQASQLEKFHQASYSLDIGAESTAPFNDAIDYSTEWSRLKAYFDANLRALKKFEVISLDTYKIETMKSFMSDYGKFFENIIWNDVSGKLCEEGISFLRDYPELKYVLCHNLAPTRSLASSHMDFIEEDFDIDSLEDFFTARINQFEQASLGLDRLILDPCFGFSKTLEQNLELLERVHEIKNIHPHWLIGISKKSFLRHLVSLNTPQVETHHVPMESEKYHWKYLELFKKHFRGVNSLYLRVHEVGNITD